MKKIYFLLLISILTLPFFAFGDVYEYTPLVTIPGSGVEANQPVNLGAYLNGIYRILIAITIILAVIVITISGIQHMASESPFSKSEASKRIGGAIGGIVLAVMSWLILFTINPCLVSFNFLTPTAACGGPNKPNTNNQTPNDDGLLSLDDLDKIAAGERHCFLSNRVDTGETLETCGINRLDCQNIREETLTFLTRTNVGTCIHQP